MDHAWDKTTQKMFVSLLVPVLFTSDLLSQHPRSAFSPRLYLSTQQVLQHPIRGQRLKFAPSAWGTEPMGGHFCRPPEQVAQHGELASLTMLSGRPFPAWLEGSLSPNFA